MIEIINSCELDEQLNIEPNKDKLFILEFFATWCEPCKKNIKILEELETQFSPEKVIFLKKNIGEGADAESNRILVEKYKIKSIPLIILFKNGVLVDRIVGLRSKEFIKTTINRHSHPSQ